jgi:hypothetical protein
MLFAVLFNDKPSHGELRTTHLDAHVRWVDAHKDRLLVAGSLRVEPGQTPRGALWIVQCDTRDEVIDLLQTDPFYTAGLRQSIEVLYWNKALPEHRALV